MDIYRALRDRHLQTIRHCCLEFRKVFGREIMDFYIPGPGLPSFDFHQLFKEIGVPLDNSSQEIMRRKYGPEAVELIGRLL